MVSEWKKIEPVAGLITQYDTIFFIPTKTGGVKVCYGDEYCIVDDSSVQDIMNKFKYFDGNFMATKGAMKSLIRNVLNN